MLVYSIYIACSTDICIKQEPVSSCVLTTLAYFTCSTCRLAQQSSVWVNQTGTLSMNQERLLYGGLVRHCISLTSKQHLISHGDDNIQFYLWTLFVHISITFSHRIWGLLGFGASWQAVRTHLLQIYSRIPYNAIFSNNLESFSCLPKSQSLPRMTQDRMINTGDVKDCFIFFDKTYNTKIAVKLHFRVFFDGL